MLKASLVRFAYLPKCVLGWLTLGDLRLATIEDAWRRDVDGPGGQRREGSLLESCVPDGIYRLEPHVGQKWQNVRALVNPALGVYHWSGDIPAGLKYGRSAILMHSGVDDGSSLGCIILGLSHGIEGGRYRVYDSQQALNQWRAALVGGVAAELSIRPVTGTAEL